MAKEVKKERLKFLRNTSYDRKEYGPDYETDVADVAPYWAARFKNSGRAVPVDGSGDDDETGNGSENGDGGTDTDPDAERRAELTALNVKEDLTPLAKTLGIDTNGMNKKPLIEAIIEAEKG